MIYLFYKWGTRQNRKGAAIRLDERLPEVEIFSKIDNSLRKDTDFWIRYHKEYRANRNSVWNSDETFEICKNQFDKFNKTGEVPENWDF